MARSPLAITVGEPRPISRAEGYHWFPTMRFRLGDGSLLLGYSIGPEELATNVDSGMPHAQLKSPDHGLNWFLLNAWRGRFYSEALPIGVLPDGRVLGTCSHVALQNATGDPYLLEYTSHDHARSWEGPRLTPLRFPDGMLAPEGNVQPGRSWSYAATIADQSDSPRNFNESALVGFDDSELLCVMGTDLDGPNPLYQSRSADSGRNWNSAVPCNFSGADRNWRGCAAVSLPVAMAG